MFPHTKKSSRTTRRGFTLIELMVVISIISLLASIVLASLQNARERAIIVKLLSFGTSIKHLNWDTVIGEWNFNDPTNLAKDTSGNANAATSTDGVYSPQPVINGTFDGGTNGGYIEVGDIDTPQGIQSKLGGGASVLTIELMIKPGTNSFHFGILSKDSYALYYNPSVNYTSSGYPANNIAMSPRSLCTQCLIFSFYNGSTAQGVNGKFAHSVNMSPNTWHHIAVVYNSTQGTVVKMYFDGVQMKNPSYYGVPVTAAPLFSSNEPLDISWDRYNTYDTFPGLIDELRIYTSDTGL